MIRLKRRQAQLHTLKTRGRAWGLLVHEQRVQLANNWAQSFSEGLVFVAGMAGISHWFNCASSTPISLPV